MRTQQKQTKPTKEKKTKYKKKIFIGFEYGH